MADQDVDPTEFGALLNDFPLDAAAASYVFTILEGHGNTLVAIANKNYFKQKDVPRNAAWHHLVWGDVDIEDAEKMQLMRRRYGIPFKQTSQSVGMFAPHRLIILKSLRNDFIHDLDDEIIFDRFIALAVGVVCDLEFMLVPESQIIKEFPFEDLHEAWGRIGPPYCPQDENDVLEELEMQLERGKQQDAGK